MKRILLCLVALTGLISGCSQVMSSSWMDKSDLSLTYNEISSNPDKLTGRIVMVGGTVALTLSSGDFTEMEIIQHSLLTNGVPDESAASEGRFRAVSGELLDPSVNRTGMPVTIIGEIKGRKDIAVEGKISSYPLIAIREMRFFTGVEVKPVSNDNPYQNRIGDGRFMLRPPAQPAELR